MLSLGVTGFAALAGCTQFTGEDADDSDDPEDRFPDEEDIFTDVEVLTLRFDTTDPVIMKTDSSHRIGRRYLVDEADVDELEFVDEPLGGEDPYEFLRSIDYDEATALVLSDGVGACERQSLKYVRRRSGGGLRVRFCRTYRDPDVECSVGDQHTQVTLIEVPVSFDSQPSGFGRGGSSRCILPPGHPAGNAGVTDDS